MSLTLNTEQISSADGVVLVVTPHKVSEQLVTQSTVDQLKESTALFARGKALILINTLYVT
jgi:hypothetical protein